MFKRSETIDVNLNLDLDSEIREKINNISADIKLYTSEILKNTKASIKMNKVSKTEQKRREGDGRMFQAIKLLAVAYKQDDKWVSAKQLIEITESKSQAHFTLQMKRYLRKADNWLLKQKKKNGETHYSLQQFD